MPWRYLGHSQKAPALTQCDPPPLKNPGYALGRLWLKKVACLRKKEESTAALGFTREFKIYDATVAKTSLKIASASLSIFFVIVSIYLTFES